MKDLEWTFKERNTIYVFINFLRHFVIFIQAFKEVHQRNISFHVFLFAANLDVFHSERHFLIFLVTSLNVYHRLRCCRKQKWKTTELWQHTHE